MFYVLFFISPFVFILLAIILPLCITKVKKAPVILTLNIGKLNTDDIRKLDGKDRKYLRNQVMSYFIIAVFATLLISFAFIIIGNADNGLLAIPCNLIGLVVGLVIASRVFNKTNALKEKEMEMNDNL